MGESLTPYFSISRGGILFLLFIKTFLAVAVNCVNHLYMGKPITVLIADDNDFFRETLRILLSGVEEIVLAGEAKNGEEAIAFAMELCPHIVLMDINMSPVNGFEATRKIIKQNPAIRIIGLSMHSEASYCKNLLRLGAKGYVTKSAPHTAIIDAIREVAAGGRYIDKEILGL
jgi:two-component system, NarL family, invasion response regulator UvrY